MKQHHEGGAQSRPREGSGLGLAIIKAMAERHGATVDLLTRASGCGLDVRVCFALP